MVYALINPEFAWDALEEEVRFDFSTSRIYKTWQFIGHEEGVKGK